MLVGIAVGEISTILNEADIQVYLYFNHFILISRLDFNYLANINENNFRDEMSRCFEKCFRKAYFKKIHLFKI